MHPRQKLGSPNDSRVKTLFFGTLPRFSATCLSTNQSSWSFLGALPSSNDAKNLDHVSTARAALIQTPSCSLPLSPEGFESLYFWLFVNCVQASTQTDATRVPVFRRRQMKNKSVLCRPYTTDQETLCQLPETWTESAGSYRLHACLGC